MKVCSESWPPCQLCSSLWLHTLRQPSEPLSQSREAACTSQQPSHCAHRLCCLPGTKSCCSCRSHCLQECSLLSLSLPLEGMIVEYPYQCANILSFCPLFPPAATPFLSPLCSRSPLIEIVILVSMSFPTLSTSSPTLTFESFIETI